MKKRLFLLLSLFCLTLSLFVGCTATGGTSPAGGHDTTVRPDGPTESGDTVGDITEGGDTEEDPPVQPENPDEGNDREDNPPVVTPENPDKGDDEEDNPPVVTPENPDKGDDEKDDPPVQPENPDEGNDKEENTPVVTPENPDKGNDEEDNPPVQPETPDEGDDKEDNPPVQPQNPDEGDDKEDDPPVTPDKPDTKPDVPDPPTEPDEPKEPETFTVTLLFDGTQGTLTLSPAAEHNVYPTGTAVTVTAAPLTGYALVSLLVNGVPAAHDGGTYTFTIAENTTIEAVFETATMPETLFARLLGRTAYTGEGNETRKEGAGVQTRIYAYTVAFDGTISQHCQSENGILLHDFVYRNENGRAVSYVRRYDNTFQTTDTGKNYDLCCDPFAFLTAKDFAETEGGYLLTDPEKAARAAFAFTGKMEEIARFAVSFRQDTTVLAIETVSDARGEENGNIYRYFSSYTFVSAEPEDLTQRITPYETVSEHAALKSALERADGAESFTYEISDGTQKYRTYVTKNAIYCDRAGQEYGFILHSDGYVHALVKGDGTLTVGDVLTDENGPVTDLYGLRPRFCFAAELFVPKDGGFALRRTDPELIGAVAQLCLHSDSIAMRLATDMEIILSGEDIGRISVTAALHGETIVYTLEYSGRNATQLPLPVEDGTEGPDDPVTPQDPETNLYPAAFLGTYEGEDASGIFCTMEIAADGITVSFDGEVMTAQDIVCVGATISFTLDGMPFEIAANGTQAIAEIQFKSSDFTISATLRRV